MTFLKTFIKNPTSRFAIPAILVENSKFYTITKTKLKIFATTVYCQSDSDTIDVCR